MTLRPSDLTYPHSHGVLGRLISELSMNRSRLDTVNIQISSGQITDRLSGLGTEVGRVLSLHLSMSAISAWRNSIETSNARTDVTLLAMDRIIAISSEFYAKTNNMNGLNATNIDSTAAAARSSLKELAGLLNTKDGNVFVFSGQDTANPAVPGSENILSSGFYTQIAASIASLSTSGAAVTATSTLAIASSNATGTSPFSDFLSQPASNLQGLRTGLALAHQYHEYVGILASANAESTSSGTSTTGSYMRDLMRSLATIGSMNSSQIGDTGFAELVEDTRTSLRGAIDAMATDAGILGDTRARLHKMSELAGTHVLSATDQANEIEGIDMASAIAQLTDVQAKIQASYQIISSLRELSLARYLS